MILMIASFLAGLEGGAQIARDEALRVRSALARAR
jgi:hypothetical protein